jgi:hypothetical protein
MILIVVKFHAEEENAYQVGKEVVFSLEDVFLFTKSTILWAGATCSSGVS